MNLFLNLLCITLLYLESTDKKYERVNFHTENRRFS